CFKPKDSGGLKVLSPDLFSLLFCVLDMNLLSLNRKFSPFFTVWFRKKKLLPILPCFILRSGFWEQQSCLTTCIFTAVLCKPETTTELRKEKKKPSVLPLLTVLRRFLLRFLLTLPYLLSPLLHFILQEITILQIFMMRIKCWNHFWEPVSPVLLLPSRY